MYGHGRRSAKAKTGWSWEWSAQGREIVSIVINIGKFFPDLFLNIAGS